MQHHHPVERVVTRSSDVDWKWPLSLMKMSGNVLHIVQVLLVGWSMSDLAMASNLQSLPQSGLFDHAAPMIMSAHCQATGSATVADAEGTLFKRLCM